MNRGLQMLLAGMPERRPVLRCFQRGDEQVVTAGGVVLFGPYRAGDLGARNLAIVNLTLLGFGVGQVAEAFGLRPGTVSHLRTAFRRGGSAALVKISGRPAQLNGQVVAEVRGWLEEGYSQQEAADRLGVSPSAVSHALRRHRAVAPQPAPVADELSFVESDAAEPAGAEGPAAAEEPTAQAEPAGQQEQAAAEGPAAQAEPAGQQEQAAAEGPAAQAEPAGAVELVAGAEVVLRPATELVGRRMRGLEGSYPSRYAGAMLAYFYLDRSGAGEVLAGLDGAAWRRLDQAQLATFTVLALLCGVGSIEGVKTLIRSQAGPLVGLAASPQLRTLRPRLAAIADRTDVADAQRRLAAGMLTTAGESAGIYYVDDHFVPYGGAKPVAKGHNGKRGRAEKGRADTLVTDARGRAVCFTTGEPSHLSKTMQPALRELRQIIPTGPVLLGFDRGGAYAEAFTACRQADIDFITYRRGAPAATTAEPAAHRIRRGRNQVEVILADEPIAFPNYDGPCRQLTLYERTCGCAALAGCTHLRPVLQVLTSDTTASAPNLLLTLKGRWVIENAFKYLDYYGIDWLVDYHAETTARTALVRNPARDTANAAIRAAKTELAETQRALGELLDANLPPAAKNAAIPAARTAITHAQHKINTLTTHRDTIPTQLPANQIDPTAQRALHRTHRRGLTMMLRLLAYNTDTWLADHLNTYLQDPNEYRAITRNLMHTPGTITYTPDHITVTLDPPDTPRITRALTNLITELNHTPPHIPGDPRPITYKITHS